MINAVIAIELETYLERDGQIEVVHDQGQPVDGVTVHRDGVDSTNSSGNG